MVVWMNGLRPAFEPQDLSGAVGDHFVSVHVCRSSAASLEDVDGKLGIPTTLHHLGRSLDNSIADERLKVSRVHVGSRASALDQAERVDESPRKDQSADGEVLNRARGLSAVISVCRNFHLAE